MTHSQVEIPISGNAFITEQAPKSNDRLDYDRGMHWACSGTVLSVYFKTSIDAELTIALKIAPAAADAVISATIGDKTTQTEISAGCGETVQLGSWKTNAGYIRLDLRGLSKQGDVFAKPEALLLEGISGVAMASYAKPDDKDDFYWSRRGPSVHCRYETDGIGDDVEWFYNEVEVMPGEDPPGTFAMSIGFTGGYFGQQVTDGGQRKIIFSVWSPYTTDDPEEIPEELCVRLLKKHPDVKTGGFGNEGSGSQSLMNYNWKSGERYKYLMHIVPAGDNRTRFTAYFFFPETGKWELFCSFLRPETDIYVKNVYSFLESFIDTNGYEFRKAHFYNQWAVTKTGRWIPISEMQFTGDATARKGQRQDYSGGVEDNHFFLQNCGFFTPNVVLDTVFTVDPEGYKKPEIDLEELEKAR